MAKKLKTQDLVGVIDAQLQTATTYSTKVSQDRADTIRRLNGEPYGTEKKGRSSYISREIQEVVSWALPLIAKNLLTDDAVKFDPTGPGTEIPANFATEFAKYQYYKKNNGFLTTYNAVFDMLTMKNAVTMVSIDKTPEYSREEYQNVSLMQLTLLTQNPKVEIVEKEATQGIDPMTGVPTELYNVAIKVPKTNFGRFLIENVPPEEIIISRRTRGLDLDNSPFVCRKKKVTLSWLREQGYKVADDIQDGSEANTEYQQERVNRMAQDGTYYGVMDDPPTDPAQREVWMSESFLKIDFDGDGIAERRRVLKVGNKILENDEVLFQPFIGSSAMPIPHKFYGWSLAELVKDLQLLKTMLIRASLDSFAFGINPPKAVDVTKLVDVNDLADANPGNWIRLRGDANSAVQAFPQTGIGGDALQLLQYIDDVTESRSGVSRYTQGIDQNSFNKTATGTQAIMTASQEKLALMTRIIGETYLAKVFKKIIELAAAYIKEPVQIPINSEWTVVNPQQWSQLETLTISVGTGAAEQQQQVGNASQILQMQQAVLGSKNPELMALVTPDKVFSAVGNMSRALGYKQPVEFFNNPNDPTYLQAVQKIQQQMQPPPDPNMALVQVQAKQVEQNMLMENLKLQLSKQKQDREFELDKSKLMLDNTVKLAVAGSKHDLEIADVLIGAIGNLNPQDGALPGSEMAALQEVGTIQARRAQELAQQQQQEQAQREQMLQEQAMQQQELQAQLEMHKQAIEAIHSHVTKPKKHVAHKFIYDEQGNITGAEPVGINNSTVHVAHKFIYDEQGNITGAEPVEMNI